MSNPAEEMWNILNDLEDVLQGGFTSAHPACPPVGVPQLQPADSAKPEDAATSAERSSATTPPAEGVEPAPQANDGGGGAANDLLKSVEHEVRSCARCELGLGRTNAVPGMGSANPDVFVIGEGPGAEEDRTGLPFVGPAGRYLDKWLAAIDLSRETNTFIGNIVKCRPPGNRDPRPEEASACMPYLMRQIEILKPRALLTVGRIAAGFLLNTTKGIGATRGRVYLFHDIPLVATYHPSGVLRNPGYRREVWEDLKLLRSVLDDDPTK